MKVLVISNMYPSKQKPYSGIFVKNQFEYIKENFNNQIDKYVMERTFTSFIGSIIKYLKFNLGFIPLLFIRFKVIHVHFFGYHSFLGLLYKYIYPSTKLIITFHGSDTSNIKKRLFRLVAKKTYTAIAVGKEQSEFIKLHAPTLKVEIISAGIDKRVFYPENLEKEYDFIFIGSFYKIKGVDIVINAIKEINQRDLRFCFVGSGPYEKEIEALKKIATIDLFKNQKQNQIQQLISKSKFLVIPSRGDSFGLVVTEAMYCGTPAIVSNIGGVKDQVVDGVNGFVMQENNSKELINIMTKLNNISKSSYADISKAATTSNKQHSLHNSCLELIRIYSN